MIRSDNIDEIYFQLCGMLLGSDNKTSGYRDGNCSEIMNAQVCLTNVDNNIISIRNISKVYLMAELTWYFAGRNDVAFIGAFAKKWKDLSDDGITNNSAYGYLLKSGYGFNQIEKVIELLKKDPMSRRAVININVPNVFVIETKDEPCTIALQFLIRNKKLYCTAIMRSNDIWYGFPYDVAFFTELQKYIATRLEIEPGDYTHFATSLHVYEKDRKQISKINLRKSDPVIFNRDNFFTYVDVISERMDPYVRAEKDVKENFIRLLNEYNIMEVKK